MYAIIKAGGKQYKIANEDVVKLEKLQGEAGKVIRLDQVIAISDGKTITLGSPVVKGASVTAQILEQKKGDKVLIFKKRRRKNYRRKQGHRQLLTVVRIIDITGKDEAPRALKPKKEAVKQEAPAAAQQEKKAAPAKAKAEKKPAAKPETAKAEKPAAAKKTTAKKKE